LVHVRTRPRRQVDRAVFRPPRALGVITGGAFCAWAVVGSGLAANVAVGAPAEFKTFLAWAAAAVFGALALVFANWTYGVASMAYTVDRSTLTITWGFRHVVVPIETIQRMVPGRTLDEAHVHGLNWWGVHVGSADVKRIGFTLFYSTHGTPDELLYIVTTGESYALTVLDQAGFAEEIQGRAAMGPVGTHAQRATARGIAAFPFWRDHVAMMCVAASAVVCAALSAYVYGRYPGLPAVVQMDFPAFGGVVRVGNKSELLRLVYAGVGVFVTNSALGLVVHAKERAAGLWLFASGGMIQAVLLGAAVLAFSRA
jgi:hypothetical protein